MLASLESSLQIDPGSIEIVPLQERLFDGMRAALDVVARERRYLALQAAPPREEAFAYYRSFLARNLPCYIALLDDRVVGWSDIDAAFGESRAHVGVLGIALIPEARGKGVGSVLMRASIQAAWDRGFTRVELSVRADNVNAKALYERIGFSVEGLNRRSFLVDGDYFDSFSMALLRE